MKDTFTNLISKVMSVIRKKEFIIVFFFVVFLMLNWPFLTIADKGNPFHIYFYLFFIVVFVIIMLFLIQYSYSKNADTDSIYQKVDKGDLPI
ncbi:MAG: hypothetical protein DKM50_08245 [Candidatus Margulisiibacteriota bacterium]|nr:MAG: hypothetical protein A2X43_03025 [Candidatus Margulisbacteria bacterium GWD2_39_127]OGI02616.1 MAG: hypothetical protein A2X42_10940 [Candidatus Margulisbacteria bacterium GWF2_38_17]OGI10767.1 MAG: hypothetical protein A2X41_10425 [Candidatus Margulisbacteria bacterium GWE2_39_32]PZM79585.1 MAG: hypothetical protein DKM50_08245 [Candidatus Margulisiibacteriota bacterium]HAR63233.1 hypothetical protein [Candidatus Margulisiibacteriota bacterium]